jgi:hypothetical protein
MSITSSSSGFVDFVLNRLRVAGLQVQIAHNEIQATAAALAGGLIDAEAALGCLDESGLFNFVTGLSS